MSAAVDFAIVKSMDSSSIWQIFHKDLPQNKYIQFSADALSPAGGTTYFTTSTTTLGFRDGSNSSSGDEMIAYAWREISGYSSIGTYTGNGATSGKIINTGFEPSWIMFKPTSTAGYWYILDNERSTANPRNKGLFPNDPLAEIQSTNYNVDFLSNGFELKNNTVGFNQNNVTYIYMAFK